MALINWDVVDEQTEPETWLKDFSKNFHGDSTALVKQYMEYFFRGKKSPDGGKIPISSIWEEKNVSMVLNYSIMRALNHAYRVLEPLLSKEEIEDCQLRGEATSDVRLVHGTLELVSLSGIPMKWGGGMLMLYLKFVEGIDIGDPMMSDLEEPDLEDVVEEDGTCEKQREYSHQFDS